MPIRPDAEIEITAFDWVPPFAKGFVRDLRPRWACEELGLPYRERLISAMKRPEWYYDDQPWGQVPYLRHGEICQFESGAILIHLAETGGGLLPGGGQERASTLSWLFAALNSIEPMLFELSNVEVFSAKSDWAPLRRPSLLETVGKRLDRLEARVPQDGWIAGEFSIADIALVTALRELAGRGQLKDRATLTAYVERATARPAFQAALKAQLATFDAHAPAETAGA
ncbi:MULTISPECIES: glutathione S-transferase family protein [Novosphingobium]|uniref:Glutathione S-transferase n=1 Tax=Novosphingobium mathurense TaxID=428990 RepID=A0A1U6H1V5_9SPHN|nr:MULTISPECIES: glutathione S-transferase family protein [Novosphingobium]CDO34727.1 Glutathione S-transferase-like protein [Novosphingobium sp. KN65.2]SLJ89759.1 glutathione S-transferase [Novosphingobium mathurense]